MKSNRRVHFRIDELPGDLQVAAIRMLTKGRTYREIGDFFRRRGNEFGHSTSARWALRIRRDGGYIPQSSDTVSRARMIVRNAITVLQSLDTELSNHADNRGIYHE
jgi:hypothetical protein